MKNRVMVILIQESTKWTQVISLLLLSIDSRLRLKIVLRMSGSVRGPKNDRGCTSWTPRTPSKSNIERENDSHGHPSLIPDGRSFPLDSMSPYRKLVLEEAPLSVKGQLVISLPDRMKSYASRDADHRKHNEEPAE
jgi:hypothetical protein